MIVTNTHIIRIGGVSLDTTTINHYKRTYLIIITLIIALSLIFIQLLALGSKQYTASIDAQYAFKSQQPNSPYIVPGVIGQGMGLDYLMTIPGHTEDHNFILFGTSTAIVGPLKSELQLPEGFTFINASSGSATISGMIVMKNFLQKKNYQLTSQDIVKIDISPATFGAKKLDQEVITSALEYGGVFEVGDDMTVTSSILSPLYQNISWNARDIQKAGEYFYVNATEHSFDSIYLTPEMNFKGYHKLLNFSKEKKGLVENFITETAAETSLIVDIVYMHPQLQTAEAGILFNRYIDEELIPYLENNNIQYRDNRFLFSESDFVDGTHLNYQARERYTASINEDLIGGIA